MDEVIQSVTRSSQTEAEVGGSCDELESGGALRGGVDVKRRGAEELSEQISPLKPPSCFCGLRRWWRLVACR